MSRMLRSLCSAAAGLWLLSAAGPVLAHHSFAAEYDADHPVDLRGFITKTRWANPHTRVYLQVIAANGSIDTWGVEFGPPNFLENRGLKKSDLKRGTHVEIQGYRAKNGGLWAYSVKLTLDDGRTFSTGTASDAPPLPAHTQTGTPPVQGK